ncbi:hypothetical protein O181_033878 [Austropuccinia psidii MF-1]|uniref:Uncharacterized protein n=1 Tax=Austropuccinia psidii MF-1 TaxID=1389203 RepID=A0A9Q3D2C7_9BASI|nr:hypothetical protein [Austropuccinia psidii MF-1]
MRQEYGKNDWIWWKSQIITQLENNSWRCEMENSFENSILNSEKDQLTPFLKQKYRLSALYPDMSESIIYIEILRKCGGKLDHSIKRRDVEPCLKEYYINEMEDIMTRTRIFKNWSRNCFQSRIVQNTSREERIPDRTFLKCHQCGITLPFANTCTKKSEINEV